MIELHNAWTVFLAEADEETPAIIQFARPQDWGHPELWHYRKVSLEIEIKGKLYRNSAHIWIDIPLDELEVHETDWFRELVFSVQYPGMSPRLCAKDYLDDEDIWDEAWGKMPAFYDKEEDPWTPYYG